MLALKKTAVKLKLNTKVDIYFHIMTTRIRNNNRFRKIYPGIRRRPVVESYVLSSSLGLLNLGDEGDDSMLGLVTSVADYGATGDGVTDDTNAIRDALDALTGSSTPGGCLFFPKGNYRISDSIIIDDRVTIKGENRLASRIISNMTGTMVRFQNVSHSLGIADRGLNIFIEDIGFDNTSVNNAGSIGIDFSQVSLGGMRQVDVRNVHTAVYVSNVSYNNMFDSISTVGTNVAFKLENGPNDNTFYNCRGNNTTYGFHMVDGFFSAGNNVNFNFCKVETFHSAAFYLEHLSQSIDDNINVVFFQCRMTTGPIGFLFSGTGDRTIRSSLPFQCHFDDIDQAYSFRGISIFDRNTALHQGIWNPLRIGDPEATDYSLMYFNTGTNQTLLRNNTNSVPTDLVVNDLTVDATVGTERINIPRIRFSDGGAHTSDAYALSAEWGNSVSLSVVAASDSSGIVDITPNGLGISTNPTLTLTFVDGAFPTPPKGQVSRGDIFSPSTAEWRVTNQTTGSITFTFVGLPVALTTYRLIFNCFG